MGNIRIPHHHMLHDIVYYIAVMFYKSQIAPRIRTGSSTSWWLVAPSCQLKSGRPTTWIGLAMDFLRNMNRWSCGFRESQWFENPNFSQTNKIIIQLNPKKWYEKRSAPCAAGGSAVTIKLSLRRIHGDHGAMVVPEWESVADEDPPWILGVP